MSTNQPINKAGYKHTEFGWLPKEWKVTTLGKIAKITSGATPLRSVNAYFDPPIHSWVKTTDLTNSIILETEEKVSPLALEKTSLRLYPKDTILVAMYGGYKQIGRTGLLGIEAAVNQALSGLAFTNPEVDSKFVLYWLNAKVALWKRFAGSSRKDPNITSKDVAAFPIALPPLAEQRAIAEILQKWDSAIALTEALIAQKELRKKWLMQQLLTGKKRLKGFDGEWKRVSFGEVFRERTENNCPDLPLLSIGQKGVYPQSDDDKKDTSNSDKSKYKQIRPGDIGYNTMRMWQGRSALSELDGIVSPAYTVITTKPNFDARFCSILLTQPFMTYRFWRVSQGLVDDTLNCRFKDLALVRTMVPPTLQEQVAIRDCILNATAEIKSLEELARNFVKVRSFLSKKLLSANYRIRIL